MSIKCVFSQSASQSMNQSINRWNAVGTGNWFVGTFWVVARFANADLKLFVFSHCQNTKGLPESVNPYSFPIHCHTIESPCHVTAKVPPHSFLPSSLCPISAFCHNTSALAPAKRNPSAALCGSELLKVPCRKLWFQVAQSVCYLISSYSCLIVLASQMTRFSSTTWYTKYLLVGVPFTNRMP